MAHISVYVVLLQDRHFDPVVTIHKTCDLAMAEVDEMVRDYRDRQPDLYPEAEIEDSGLLLIADEHHNVLRRVQLCEDGPRISAMRRPVNS